MKKITLPDFTRGEEWFSSISHIVGAAFSIVILILCLWQSVRYGGGLRAVFSALIYGTSSIVLYTCSSVYHGLYANKGKKVMRIIDHCSVYILICGTYTPYLFMCVYPQKPALAISIFVITWLISAGCMALTAVSYERFKIILIASYAILGWSVMFTVKPLIAGLRHIGGFRYMLAGGIIYTLGIAFFAAGRKRRWMHSIFHLFVLAASASMFVGIFLYVLTIQ